MQSDEAVDHYWSETVPKRERGVRELRHDAGARVGAPAIEAEASGGAFGSRFTAESAKSQARQRFEDQPVGEQRRDLCVVVRG